MFGREPPSPPSWQKRSEPGWRPTPWRCTLRRRCSSADTARCGPGRGGNDCSRSRRLPPGAVCWGRWNPQPGGDRVGVSWARWRHCAPSGRGLHNVDRERRAGCPCVFLRLRSSGWRFQRVPVIHFSFWICWLSTPSEGDTLIGEMVAGVAFIKDPVIYWISNMWIKTSWGHSPSSSPYPARGGILTKKKQKLKEVKRINFWDHTARKYRRTGLCDFGFSVFHYNMLSSPFWYGIPRTDVIEYGGSGDKTDPRRIWNKKLCLFCFFFLNHWGIVDI